MTPPPTPRHPHPFSAITGVRLDTWHPTAHSSTRYIHQCQAPKLGVCVPYRPKNFRVSCQSFTDGQKSRHSLPGSFMRLLTLLALKTIGNQAHLKKKKTGVNSSPPHLPPTESRCSLFDLFGCTRGSRIVSQNVIMTEHYDLSQQPRLINVTAFSCKFSFFFPSFPPQLPSEKQTPGCAGCPGNANIQFSHLIACCCCRHGWR